MTEPLPDLLIAPIVRAALTEDLGRAGDVTSPACVPADARLHAVFAARKAGVVSGLGLRAAGDLRTRSVRRLQGGGGRWRGGSRPATSLPGWSANARALLAAERVALNLLGRLSGIATLTPAYVDAVDGTGARDHRHPQDHCRACAPREIRRALRRRRQPSLRPRRRDPDQGQPHRRLPARIGARCKARQGRRRPPGEGRDRGRHAWPSSRRPWPHGPDVVMLDNFSLARPARGGRDPRPAARCWKRRAASPSTRSAPSPRPAST